MFKAMNSRGSVSERRRSLLAYKKAHYQANKEDYIGKAVAWRIANPEKRRAVQRKCRLNRAEEHRSYNRLWFKRNKHLRAQYEGLRRALRGRATIAGHQAALEEFYANCPAGYHVDHVIPLKGTGVCGLHVPWNLQYLPAVDNLSKGNKLPESVGPRLAVRD